MIALDLGSRTRLRWKTMISASGGLVYHARAIKSLVHRSEGHDLWRPARCSVSKWVREWLILGRFENLVIVGPSAAYLLNSDVFDGVPSTTVGRRRLNQMTIIDPDRMAEAVFRIRFHHAADAIRWQARSDLLPHTSTDPEAFARFLKPFDPATTGVLFFGCLGQLALHRETFVRSEQEARRLLLSGLSENRFRWASVHDLESAALKASPSSTARTEIEALCDVGTVSRSASFLSNRELRVEQLDQKLRPEGVEPRLTWIDHDTDWIGEPSAIAAWFLSPTKLHLLGFHASNSSESKSSAK